MSGAFGWHRDNTKGDDTQASPGYFDQGSRAVPQPSVTVKTVGQKAQRVPTPIPSRPSLNAVAATQARPIPDGKHAQKTTGEVVIIIALDVTGSMSTWPTEIFDRLPRLYQVACDYFGTQDLDVLFIAHGDARTDRYAIQVGHIARGQALEIELASFHRKCGGGGQGTESQEVVAAYLRDRLDVSSARMVYTFFVTDEAACDVIDPALAEAELGINIRSCELNTAKVFGVLAKRMRLYTVLCSTTSYDSVTRDEIKRFWEATVGREHVVPLEDARRVVDVMLGVFAKTTGQLDRFTRDLSAWQAGTAHACQNVQTVMGSIALVGGQLPTAPKLIAKTATRALLPPADDDKK